MDEEQFDSEDEALDAIIATLADCLPFMAASAGTLPALTKYLDARIRALEPTVHQRPSAAIHWHAMCEILKKAEMLEAAQLRRDIPPG